MALARGIQNSVVRVILLAAVVTSCGSSSVAPGETNTPRKGDPRANRVLFIGNSLTAANGLPPVGLPAWTQMTIEHARLLQEASHEANAQFGRR